MFSQHRRPQALIKKEGCDRLGKATLNLAILIETKAKKNPLGNNPLSNVPYQNLDMVLNEQGSCQHW